MSGRVFGLVLAGGISERFGGDKLVESFQGEPLIRRVCRAVSKVTSGVYLSAREPSRAKRLLGYVSDLVRGVLIDGEDVTCKGPLAGIVTAIMSLDCEYVLAVSGDLPKISPEPLAAFLEACLDRRVTSASIVWGNGMVDSLIQLHELRSVKDRVGPLCSARREMARPSDLLRCAERLLLVHARNLTRDATLFANVNTREDLECPKPRGPFEGDVNDDVVLELGRGSPFWGAFEAIRRGDFGGASELYESEGYLYLGRNLHHLAAHCFADSARMASMSGNAGRAERLRLLGEEAYSKMRAPNER